MTAANLDRAADGKCRTPRHDTFPEGIVSHPHVDDSIENVPSRSGRDDRRNSRRPEPQSNRMPNHLTVSRPNALNRGDHRDNRLDSYERGREQPGGLCLP